MSSGNATGRHRLAAAAAMWAAAVGLIMGVGASLWGFETSEALEIALLGGIGAAVCIWWFAQDILAAADYLRRSDRRTSK